MRDLTLADLRQITTDTQNKVRGIATDHVATDAALDRARRKMERAIRAYHVLRDQSREEAAHIKFNSRAPFLLADITDWKTRFPAGVITEYEFETDALLQWMTDHDLTSRTGIEKAIANWYDEELEVSVQCWFPFAIQPHWELAMGEFGRLYVGFLSNAERIATRLKANTMLPF